MSKPNSDTPVEAANDNLLNVPMLEDWYVTGCSSPYVPPELQYKKLAGKIFGDTRGRFTDGDDIFTSRIIGATGRFVTTESGTVYELGTPQDGWLEYLKEEGIAYNPEQPIRVRTVEVAHGIH